MDVFTLRRQLIDDNMYRVLYQIDDEAQIVAILRVRHRRDVYR